MSRSPSENTAQNGKEAKGPNRDQAAWRQTSVPRSTPGRQQTRDLRTAALRLRTIELKTTLMY